MAVEALLWRLLLLATTIASAHVLVGTRSTPLASAARVDLLMRAPPDVPRERSAFSHFERLTTRVNDNDEQGHVNNAVYYTFFDSAINAHLLRHGFGFQYRRFTSESSCRFLRQISYPTLVDVGLRVKLGRSTAAYQIGIFESDADEASAVGTFTHVYVNERDRPCKMAGGVRVLLQTLEARDEKERDH